MIYTYPRNSIIEKARTIVPKSFCLYLLKDKMNIFWERITNHRNKKTGHDPIIDQFFNECKKQDSEVDYDSLKFAQYLKDKDKAEKLKNGLQNHIVLQRECLELNYLLTNKDGLLKELEFFKESIENDLNIIYRIRNQIIHSANSVEDYLDFGYTDAAEPLFR